MKKIFGLAIILCLLAGIGPSKTYAQKEDESHVKFVAAKKRCKDLPPNKRLRIRVDRFNVTSNKAGYADFGANMATHLTDALYHVNCFQVLETLDNQEDSRREQDFGKSGNTSGKTSPKTGKMRGAQVIATGEVTEYNVERNKTSIMMVRTGNSKVTVGFTIKLIDPETHTVIDSRAFKAEGKGGSSVTVYGQGKGTENNPAAEEAMQIAVNKAAEFIADDYEKIVSSLNNASAITAEEGNTTVITINSATYAGVKEFTAKIKTAPKVKDAQYSFDNGIGTIEITHDNSTNDLADYIDSKMGARYETRGVNNGAITLKQK